MSTLYELQTPTGWAAPPELWSSSSLDEVGACPRRWQLLRSRWGDYERFPMRPHPAAIEGQIVHDGLDRLARSCGQRGNPTFGTTAFMEAAAEADFFGGFAKAVVDWQERLARHPRPGPPFRLRTTPQELANRAVRLFREQYRPGAGEGRTAASVGSGAVEHAGMLRARGALSEVKLRHPNLPFLGVLDRVQLTGEGVEVVDFKSGKASEKHRTQLVRYALLWWRVASEMPTRITAQYLDGRESWKVGEAALVEVEGAIAGAIAALTDHLSGRPAPARAGPGCAWCPVRARCDDGWALGEEHARSEGRGDAELTVVGPSGPHGFLGRDGAGGEVAVVHEAAVAPLVPEVGVGQVVRVVDGVRKEKGKELEIRAWTEVFMVSERKPAVLRPTSEHS